MQFWSEISIFIFCHIIFNIPGGNAQVILDEAYQKTVVDIHNDARRSVDPTAANMRDMEWSDCLAEAAYEFMKQCQPGQTVQQIAAAKNCEAPNQEVVSNLFTSAQPMTDIATIVRIG